VTEQEARELAGRFQSPPWKDVQAIKVPFCENWYVQGYHPGRERWAICFSEDDCDWGNPAWPCEEPPWTIGPEEAAPCSS